MATPSDLAQEPSCLFRRIQELAFPALSSRKPHPSVSSIPRTSPARLAAAAASPSPTTATESTVLYLAYGSNLSSETFLGARGIRPISQINVSAPSLSLVFDLPGLPYREPTFANTALRKVPNLPDPSDPPKIPPIPPLPHPPSSTYDKTRGWSKGLIGVVYEVTPSDYATIIATEGGGSSYKQITVPCLPLPPRVSIPEKPPIELPKPFLAQTLYSPQIPDAPDDDNNDDTADPTGDDDKPEDPRKKWYWRFLKPPRRPDPAYAQPSPRYLKLITDGAAEHELPDDYQRWLRSLQPYTVTSFGQEVARLLVTALLLPLLLFFFALNKFLANKEGKLPLWLGIALGVVVNLVWMGYDGVLKPVFGDGERTEEKDDGKRSKSWTGRTPGTDEEKMGLL
ncbi:Gamma-glutamyl cyclotransferase gliK [Colletotrichum sidae]|uniref:gamma-glutamylcyclotransferase n=1 Tax=Colletotrichum sidae TaxID=1347389 RepID=A0A4R8T1K6_9PEZI|nr:Gamma-glutamyl cyclotransferase gliK [Colletotrichum sidae]